MKIELPYSMYDEVLIKAINLPGVISKIILEGANIYYCVEYWWNCEAKRVDCRECEIVPLVNERKVGIANTRT